MALKDALLKTAPKLFKETAPRWVNAYTGVTTTFGAGALVFGGMTAKGAATSIYQGNIQKTTGPATYVGNMPDYAYDAEGQVDRRTGDKTLGATGDLVFGLNSGRHGGR